MMKNAQKKTRIQLNDTRNDKGVLYGLVSPEPDYKLSLALNKKMGISLKNQSPLNITDESGNELIFSKFTYTNKSSDVIYNLISNRSQKYFLLKKLKNIDYLFHVHYTDSEKPDSVVVSLLRETESVNAVFLIDTLTLNDKYLHYIIQ